MTREDVVEGSGEDTMLFLDPADTFDRCLLGWVYRINLCVACYDADAILSQFVAEGLTDEEAYEHLVYNVVGTWAGERTPVLLFRPQSEDAANVVDQ